MNIKGIFIIALILFLRTQVITAEHNVLLDETQTVDHYALYSIGIEKSIINASIYPFESFLRDEKNVFKDLYREYLLWQEIEHLSYEDWLILINFGLIPETGESYYNPKDIRSRSTAENKKRFVNTVKRGDILITGRGIGGLVGHAAIMTTDNWVLEMPGGKGWQNEIASNNRKISKHKWFDEHATDWTNVYRCSNAAVARDAATWADRTYYNPSGGTAKTKHITYKLTPDFKSTNPSYCSKLVIQAYYFGTGNKKVIRALSNGLIVPSTIPTYFLNPYKLQHKGKF